MLRGVVYRLIESFSSKGHSSIWKLIFTFSVCNTLSVGVHLSSTPSISGPGSAAADSDWAVGRFALLRRDWTSVSREWFPRPLSRCVDVKFHTCWMTRFYNYPSD